MSSMVMGKIDRTCRGVVASTLVFGCLLASPISASALGSGGDGSQAHPYQLATCQDLQSIDGATSAGTYYVLTGTIDCSSTKTWNTSGGIAAGFQPIADFAGTLNGQNHTIVGLYINRPAASQVGIFQNTLAGAVVKNISVDATSQITAGTRTGTFVGSAVDSDLVNLHSSARITAGDLSGGIAGIIDGTVGNTQMHISRSHYSGQIESSGSAGGLTGGMVDAWTIDNSYSDGTISGIIVGGLMGYGVDTCGTIADSYAAGTLHNASSDAIGGLIGVDYYMCNNPAFDPLQQLTDPNYNVPMQIGIAIQDSFAAPTVQTVASSPRIGGIVGYPNASSLTIDNTYFDIDGAGTSDCIWSTTDLGSLDGSGCTGYSSQLLPDQFKGTSGAPVLNNWDFISVWYDHDGKFPVLSPYPHAAVIVPGSQPLTAEPRSPTVTNTAPEGVPLPNVPTVADTQPAAPTNHKALPSQPHKASDFAQSVWSVVIAGAILLLFFVIRRNRRREA